MQTGQLQLVDLISDVEVCRIADAEKYVLHGCEVNIRGIRLRDRELEQLLYRVVDERIERRRLRAVGDRRRVRRRDTVFKGHAYGLGDLAKGCCEIKRPRPHNDK